VANRRDYYFRQKVTEAELDAGFAELENADRSIMADLALIGVVYGLAISQAGSPNLTVTASGPGAAYDQTGQRCAIPSTQTVDCSVDENGITTTVTTPGNSRKLSVFIEFDRALTDPRIDGNSNTVYFVRSESFQLNVAMGAEAVSPTLPPLRSDQILLADITLVQGQTQILTADISTARRQWTFKTTSGLTIGVGTPLEAIQALATFAGTTLAGQGVGTSGARSIGVELISGSPNSTTAGTLVNVLNQLLSQINAHLNDTVDAHLATAIGFAGSGAWADGTTNPAATVEAQLDKIVSDLAGTSGAARIGSTAIGGAAQVPAGTPRSQLQEIYRRSRLTGMLSLRSGNLETLFAGGATNNTTGFAEGAAGGTSTNRLVAVDDETATGACAAYSDDFGQKWTASSVKPTQRIKAVAYGSSKWCAVGATDSIFTSTDGDAWTARTSAVGGGTNTDVAFGNGLFVVVNGTAIQTSADGITWATRTNPSGASLRAAYYDAGPALWVIVGVNTVLTSTNGTSWTDRSSTAAITATLEDVTYDPVNAVWLAAAQSGGKVFTVADPTTTAWTDRTGAASFAGGGTARVAYCDGGTIAVVMNQQVGFTFDGGATWFKQTQPYVSQSTTASCIFYVGGRFHVGGTRLTVGGGFSYDSSFAPTVAV